MFEPVPAPQEPDGRRPMPGNWSHCLSTSLLVFVLCAGVCFLYTHFSSSLLGSFAMRPPLENDIQTPPELTAIFRPGDWELEKNTRILKIRNLMILVSEMQNPQSNRITLSPCTLLCFPEGENDPVRRLRGVVTMRIHGPVDITLRKGGDVEFDIEELQIPGRVEIWRSGDPSQPDESFFLTAENVNLNRQRLWTPADFSMRCGRHSGEGTGLRLEFVQRADDEGGPLADIRMAEIQRLKYFTFAPGAFPGVKNSDATTNGGDGTANDANRSAMRFLADSREPVSVTCRSSMTFDFDTSTLSLFNDVRISQGPDDNPLSRMTCENLKLEFQYPAAGMAVATAEKSASAKDAVTKNHSAGSPERLSLAGTPQLRDLSQLAIRRLEAIGYPARLYSQPDDLEVEAKSIQYNAATEALRVTNLGTLVPQMGESRDDPVRMRLGTSQFETSEILCFLNSDEGLTRCASGPGRLILWPQPDGTANGGTAAMSGTTRNIADAELIVAWRGGMEWVPDLDAPVTTGNDMAIRGDNATTADGAARRVTLSGGVEVTAKESAMVTSNSTGHGTTGDSKLRIAAESVSLWLAASDDTASDGNAVVSDGTATDNGFYGPDGGLAGNAMARLEPLRLRAVRGVTVPQITLETTELTGLFEDIQIWFEKTPSYVAQSSGLGTMAARRSQLHQVAKPVFAQLAQDGGANGGTGRSLVAPTPLETMTLLTPVSASATTWEDPSRNPSDSGTMAGTSINTPHSSAPETTNDASPNTMGWTAKEDPPDTLFGRSRFTASARELRALVQLPPRSEYMSINRSEAATDGENSGENGTFGTGISGGTSRGIVSGVLVRELILNGQARIIEIPPPSDSVYASGDETAAEEMIPIRFEGEQLIVKDINDASMSMLHVVGTPARLSGRGVEFTSSTLTVDRRTQQIHSQGRGVVTLQPPRHTARTGPSASATTDDAMAVTANLTDPVTLTWDGHLQLEGTTLQIESVASPVTIRSGENQLESDTLEIRFRESPLADLISQEKRSLRDNIERITLGGRVHYHGIQRDENGEQSGEVELLTSRLTTDMDGQFTASHAPDGNGEFRIVQRGNFLNAGSLSSSLRAGQAGAATIGATAEPDDPSTRTAICGTFRDQMWGNWKNRELTLGNQVSAVVGKVVAWSDRLAFGGPPPSDGMKLGCNRLSVTLLPAPADGMTAQLSTDAVTGNPGNGAMAAFGTDGANRLELEMRGGAEINSREFTATAEEIKYSGEKELVTLQGTEFQPVQIYVFDPQRGNSEPYRFQLVKIWPRLGQAVVEKPQRITGGM